VCSPLRLLDLNLIKELFAELKAFIGQNWRIYEQQLSQGFDGFLERREGIAEA
jgi:hypothetical protein